jgi:outer membrane immunogenic protein
MEGQVIRSLLFALGASVSAVGIANASDFISQSPVPPKNWSGFHAGVVGTGGLFTSEMSDQWCYTACDAPDMASWGGGIGLTAGWNAQSGNFVYGVEGDVSWVGFDNELDIDGGSYLMEHRASWDYLATLRARAGLTVGNVLGYVTGGIAVAQTDYSSWYVPPFDDEGFSTSQTQVGFAAGAGVEVALNERLSLKGEYLYVGFPDETTPYQNGSADPDEDVMTYRSDAHLLRIGLNYRF